jgi:hypothetical protein
MATSSIAPGTKVFTTFNPPIVPSGAYFEYTNNLATNIIKFYSTTNAPQASSVTTTTNTYQSGKFSNFFANATTITHAGLVYGSDINSNTGAFDAYNLYFSNIATSLGIAQKDTNAYISASGVAADPGAPKVANIFTNWSTNLNVITPNSNAPNGLFPQPYQTVMQPVLIIDQALPTPGFPPYHPNFKIRVTGLGGLQADGQNLYAGGSSAQYGQLFTNANPTAGFPGFGPTLGQGMAISGNYMSNWVNGSQVNYWPFVGNFVKANTNGFPNFGRTFSFTGGNVKIEYLKPSASYTTANSSDILQTVTLTFPSATMPTPKLPPVSGRNYAGYMSNPWYVQFGTYGQTNYGWASPPTDMGGNSNSPVGFIQPEYLLPSNSVGSNANYAFDNNSSRASMGFFCMPEQMGSNSQQQFNTATTLRSVEVTYGDWRLPMMMQSVSATNSPTAANANANGYGYTIQSLANLYTPHLLYFASNAETTTGLADPTSRGGANNTNFFWRSAHTIRGVWGIANMGDNGDSWVNNVGCFVQTFQTSVTNANDPGIILLAPNPSNNNTAGRLLAHIAHNSHNINGSVMTNGPNNYSWSTLCWPEALSTVDQVGYISNSSASAMFSYVWTNSGGDFDNPIGLEKQDGPYFNKADEGSSGWDFHYVATTNNWGVGSPYSGNLPNWASVGRSRFFPNRQVPSAGILCSLPAGFDPMNPSITNAWRTLQFCPNPGSSNRAIASANGTVLPPDYMIMDLFDMPVIQPYPISDPFSTAGRVNINYQIAPFNYIHRDSALRGVLKAVDLVAVPENQIQNYKMGFRNFSYEGTNGVGSSATNYYAFRYPVHLNQTLQQFDAKFATNGFFRAGAEICSMWLYPALAQNNASTNGGLTNSVTPVVSDTPGSFTNIFNWWYGNPGTTRKGLTGSNKRAEPYTALYGNITTKSNTYQIHYRVQTLKQTSTAHGSGWSTWIDPAAGGITDKVIGEQRGSAVIERYIDPSNTALPDFASPTNSVTMDDYYSYRVFNAKQFTP